MISTDATSININVPRSTDDQGSPITSYKVFVDAGNDFTSGFSQATSYDGSSTTFAFTVLDPLVPVNGRVYRLYVVAGNVIGDSEPS